MPAYAMAAGVAIAATLLRVAVTPVIGESGPYLTVFPAVMLCGAFLGFAPAMVAALVGIIGIEYVYWGETTGLGSVPIRSLLVLASAAMAGWLGAATRTLRAVPAATPIPSPSPKPAAPPVQAPVPEPKPQIQLDDALAIAESARRAKERFLGQISHELRTPLVQALAVLEGTPADAQRDQLRGHLQHELRLIDDLLDLTRITNSKLPVYLRPMALHEVVQEAGRSCAEQIRARGQKLAFQLNAEKDLVDGDPARLVQVVAAVLSNAAKFSPEKGSINISTTSTAKKIRVTIADTGSGIGPTVLAQIFDAFEQDEAHRLSGLGIGLSIAKGLLLLHGGSIKVLSDGPEKGTQVEIVLPLLERLPDEPTLFA